TATHGSACVVVGNTSTREEQATRFEYQTIFFFQAEDGIRDFHVTGVQTCALPISAGWRGVLPPRLAVPSIPIESHHGGRRPEGDRGEAHPIPPRSRRAARGQGSRRSRPPAPSAPREIGRASGREGVALRGGGGA